jgi:hypothetical protein
MWSKCLLLCTLWTASIISAHAAAPSLAQFKTYQTSGVVGEWNSVIRFNSATKAGNTIWVVVTMSDYSISHVIKVTDSQGNVYTQLNQENDHAPGYQSVAQFYATNIAGDRTAPDAITISTGWENYRGILIGEIAGTTESPLIGTAANIQDGLAKGTDNVTSGDLTVPAEHTPALLLAVAMNTSGGSSDLGGSGFGGPAPGRGFTPLAQMWDWGTNLATFESKVVDAAGPIAATFDAPDTDSYVTIAAAFMPSQAGGPPPTPTPTPTPAPAPKPNPTPAPPPAPMPVPAAPRVTLTATPASVKPGDFSTLAWTSTGAASCTATGNWGGAKATSGTFLARPAANAAYTLTCADGGKTSSSTATVRVETSKPIPGPVPTPGPLPAPVPTSPPKGPAPELVQYKTHQTEAAQGESDTSVRFERPTKAGATLWVAVTVTDYGRTHKPHITDSQGNVFIELDQKNDWAPGYQSVIQYYAANIAGDSGEPDTVTVSWSHDLYKGVVIGEIQGTTREPLIGHAAAIQDRLGAGSNNVAAGAVRVESDQLPALAIALSMNTSGGSSNLGGSGFGGPAAGSGFRPVAHLWNWGTNLATLETAPITAEGTTTAIFSSPDTDSYVTVSAVFH